MPAPSHLTLYLSTPLHMGHWGLCRLEGSAKNSEALMRGSAHDQAANCKARQAALVWMMHSMTVCLKRYYSLSQWCTGCQLKGKAALQLEHGCVINTSQSSPMGCNLGPDPAGLYLRFPLSPHKPSDCFKTIITCTKIGPGCSFPYEFKTPLC